MAHASRHFADELEVLKQRLLIMGGLAEERVRVSMRALIERDPALVHDVINGDQDINNLHLEIDDRCFTLLALRQPMAGDLRAIVATVKINSDLERVGDLAVNIAEAADRCLMHPPVKTLVDLPRMSVTAQVMLQQALDAFVSQNLDVAEDVLRRDDVLDALKNQIFRELLTDMLGDPRTIEPGTDLILISRNLERIGDHATNIAEDVIFIVQAKDVRHHGADSVRRRRGGCFNHSREDEQQPGH